MLRWTAARVRAFSDFVCSPGAPRCVECDNRMTRTVTAILTSAVLVVGCARQQPVAPSAQATAAPPTTRPADPALLTLDEIEPRPVLRDLIAAAAATRPATTQPATRPAEPPLEALYI